MAANQHTAPATAGGPIWRAYWLPFAVWMAGIALVQLAQRLGAAPDYLAPLVYSAKTALCAALLLHYRRKGAYRILRAAARPADISLALLTGLAVAVLWILPETEWLARLAPRAQQTYLRWLVTPLGGWPDYYSPALFPRLPPSHPSLAYAPTAYGWLATLARLAGSAFVIAIIEEQFFRGFLYRWLQGDEALDTRRSPTAYDARAFWVVAVLFAIGHDRWLLGLVAGVAYGWLALRRGGLAAAATAHVTTNLALGIYVVMTGRYGFW